MAKRILLICLLLASFADVLYADGQSAPFIIPHPKEIHLQQKTFSLGGAVIVLGNSASRQAVIGAEEINVRLNKLGSSMLAVKREEDLSETERSRANLILVGRPGECELLARENVSLDGIGEQGYCIRFVERDGRMLALLNGHDPIGVLYACVTFRYLIQREEDKVFAVAADIRDWPDVRWRFTWTTIRTALREATGWDGRRPPAKPEEGLELAKGQLDWFLRHKINVFRCQELPWEDEQYRSWNRQVLQYAFDRGIWGWAFGAKSSLGEATAEKPKPELDVCFVFKRDGLRYWCWSRDEMIERHFEEEAQKLAVNLPPTPGVGGMVLVIHMPDCGNMGWHYRCDQCKNRFGNDQGAAQANVFTHYHRAMRKYIPNSKLVLVPRPYVLFDFDAPANSVYRERFERLSQLIPPDSYLVHVGGSREAVESWQRVCQPVHLAHWINSRSHGELDLDFRVNRTYYVGPDDMYFQGRAYPGCELEVLGAAEYLWNINAPGSVCVRTDPKEPYVLKPWSDVADTPDQVRKHHAAFSNPAAEWRDWRWLPLEQKAGPEVMQFLEQASRYLYGEKAAPHLLRIKGSGAIRWYALDPSMYPTADSMRSQVPGLEAAVKAAEAMVAQKIPVRSLFGEAESVFPLHRTIGLHCDLAKARTWTHLLDAQEVLGEEQWSHAADALDEAEKTLEAGSRGVREAFERMKPHQRYRNELREEQLTDLLASLSEAKPKLEVLRIECSLRQGLKRFPARPFKPRYEQGKIRVAIYQPPQDKGAVVGAQGIHEALAKEPNLEVAYVDNLRLGVLFQHHCLIFPSCREMPPDDLERIVDVRRFVGQYGGGVYLQHSSVGHPRFPLHSSVFPEICQYASRVATNRVTVVPSRPAAGAGDSAGDRLPNFEMAAHSILGAHQVGETLVHMYYDHMALALEGREGVPVLVDAESKFPVVAVGQVGRGRVVFDGTIALASPKTEAGRKLAVELGKDLNEDNFEHPAFGLSRELLVNGIRWLCGK